METKKWRQPFIIMRAHGYCLSITDIIKTPRIRRSESAYLSRISFTKPSEEKPHFCEFGHDLLSSSSSSHLCVWTIELLLKWLIFDLVWARLQKCCLASQTRSRVAIINRRPPCEWDTFKTAAKINSSSSLSSRFSQFGRERNDKHGGICLSWIDS